MPAVGPVVGVAAGLAVDEGLLVGDGVVVGDGVEVGGRVVVVGLGVKGVSEPITPPMPPPDDGDGEPDGEDVPPGPEPWYQGFLPEPGVQATAVINAIEVAKSRPEA